MHFFTFTLSDAEWQRVASAATHWDDEELSRAELLRRCVLSGAYVIRHLPQANQKALGEHFRSQLDFAPDCGFQLRLQGEGQHFSQAAGAPARKKPLR